MARLNVPRGPADRPDATTNYEGGLAFRVSPEMELYLTACVGFFGEDKFYSSGQAEYERLLKLLDRVSPEYALRLAAYARNQMHLRTLPQVILAEAAARCRWGSLRGISPVRRYAPEIALRADEPMEVLAYWIRTRGSKSKLPAALRRGLADAVTWFDAYELAKYDRAGLVKLRDAIQILHPKPKNAEQSELFRRALDGTLPPAQTWEREVSLHGNRPEVWNQIAPRMGLFALLRNLRNMVKVGAYDALSVAMQALQDRERVRASGILPFRILAAYREIAMTQAPTETLGAVMGALNAALEASVDAVPDLPGKTVVLVDLSGSMSNPLSRRSSLELRDVAGTLAAILWRKTGARVMGFTDKTQWMDLEGLSLLQAADRIADAMDGGTYAYKAMQRLVDEGVQADRVIFLSDQQCYSEGSFYQVKLTPGLQLGYVQRVAGPPKKDTVFWWWAEYRRRYPQARLWDIDLAGYGTVQFPQDDPSVTLLAGWSDQVLSLIRAVETREEVVAGLTKG